MRIWMLNQFYPPDEAPTGRMLAGVAEHLATAGHDVVVWASGGGYGAGRARPSSRSTHSSHPSSLVLPAAPPSPATVRVGRAGAGKRLPQKLVGWGGFYLRLAWKMAVSRPRPDLIVAMTTPPYLSVLARMAARWHKARAAHWVMDLYPDAMVAHGMVKEHSLAHQALVGLARFGFGGRIHGPVLTLGPCMARRTARLTRGSEEKIPWVPLWAESDTAEADVARGAARALREERGWGESDTVLLYSGNLGRGHLVGPLLEAAAGAHAAGHRHLRWVFSAHGPRMREVEEFAAGHPEVPVQMLDPVPACRLQDHLGSADIHLASLAPSWSGCMVPSKVLGSMAAGRTVLFVGPCDSSPARWIEESGGGWVVDALDPSRGLAAILENPDLKAESARRGRLGHEFARRQFDPGTNIRRVADALVAPVPAAMACSF